MLKRWLWPLIAVMVVAGSIAVVVAHLLPAAWAVPVVAVPAVTTVVRLRTDRRQRAEIVHEGQARTLLAGCLGVTAGRLPLVCEFIGQNMHELGVHPAPEVGSVATRMPPYVPRDVDAELRRRLAGPGFLLLVGDSTAGKSRTAAEVVAQVLPGHVLVAPVGRSVLADAVSYAGGHRNTVLWLDDLEGFFGTGGINKAMIGRLIGGEGHHRVVVATLRAAEMARYTAGPTTTDDAARQLQRNAREILELVEPIRIERMFSPQERDRAQSHVSDPRIETALAHADSYGVAEYLAAGPELLQEWKNAWEPGTSPRGAALVAAAIDCRRSGYTGPLPHRLLAELSELHLLRHGKLAEVAESHAAAWEWAKRQRRSTTSLISGDELSGYDVFDYLVDVEQRGHEPIADDVMSIILQHASPADAANVGSVAYAQRRYTVATHALRQALDMMSGTLGPDDPDTLASRHNLGLVLYSEGRYAEAEIEHRAVAGARSRVLGPVDPATLVSCDYHALALNELGRHAEAETLFRTVLAHRHATLGLTHRHTLRSLSHLAYVALSTGRIEEAELEHAAVWFMQSRVLGPDHPHTLMSRDWHAVALRLLGHADEAAAEHRALIEIRTQLLGADHPHTLASRSNHALALHRLGRTEEAAQEHREVYLVRSRILGTDHPHTQSSRDHSRQQ